MKTVRYTSLLFAVLLMIGGLAALPGCDIDVDRDEGAFEDAGEKLDKGAEKLGEKVEEAGEDIQDAAKDASR